jgi:hypothetical protein
MPTQNLLEVDSRKRVSLGSMTVAERYIAEQDESGIITLTPAVILSESEAKLLARPDILQQIDNARARIDAGLDDGEMPVRRRR